MYLYVHTSIACAEALKQEALDPVERVWEDVDGMVWKVTLEISRSLVAAKPTECSEIVFRRGSLRRRVEVPPGILIGALSHEELARLFARTYRSD